MISFFKTFRNFRRDSSCTALSFNKLISFRVSQNVFRSLKSNLRVLNDISNDPLSHPINYPINDPLNDPISDPLSDPLK